MDGSQVANSILNIKQDEASQNPDMQDSAQAMIQVEVTELYNNVEPTNDADYD